jgi:hypothetical protein
MTSCHMDPVEVRRLAVVAVDLMLQDDLRLSTGTSLVSCTDDVGGEPMIEQGFCNGLERSIGREVFFLFIDELLY